VCVCVPPSLPSSLPPSLHPYDITPRFENADCFVEFEVLGGGGGGGRKASVPALVHLERGISEALVYVAAAVFVPSLRPSPLPPK